VLQSEVAAARKTALSGISTISVRYSVDTPKEGKNPGKTLL
jgi:hypothetical protein